MHDDCACQYDIWGKIGWCALSLRHLGDNRLYVTGRLRLSIAPIFPLKESAVHQRAVNGCARDVLVLFCRSDRQT